MKWNLFLCCSWNRKARVLKKIQLFFPSSLFFFSVLSIPIPACFHELNINSVTVCLSVTLRCFHRCPEPDWLHAASDRGDGERRWWRAGLNRLPCSEDVQRRPGHPSVPGAAHPPVGRLSVPSWSHVPAVFTYTTDTLKTIHFRSLILSLHSFMSFWLKAFGE